jgi:hypothetical protein
LVKVLEMARIEALVPDCRGSVGRPPAERAALARAFVAKAVFNITATTALIERVTTDKILRRLCGWEQANEIPSEATFSRAFAEFAASALPSRVHEALIAQTQKNRLVGHISRDSTAIEAREKPLKLAAAEKPKHKPGRPRKGEQRPEKEARRLERQPGLSLEAMLADLPRHCAVGTKRNAKSLPSRKRRATRRAGPATSCTSMLPMAVSRSAVSSRQRRFTTAKRRYHWPA